MNERTIEPPSRLVSGSCHTDKCRKEATRICPMMAKTNEVFAEAGGERETFTRCVQLVGTAREFGRQRGTLRNISSRNGRMKEKR